MGAWDYKALDNDTACDTMSWVIDVVESDIKLLPFVTQLLLQSEDDYHKLLGVVIVVSCKVKPNRDLYTCSNNVSFEESVWMKIYEKTKSDKDFNHDMFFYGSGYMYGAIRRLQENINSWSKEIRQVRLHYLDRLMKICELEWKFLN